MTDVLVIAIVATICLLISLARAARTRHYRRQAWGLHPANPRPHTFTIWGNSGWWVVAIIVMICVLILVLAS